MGIYCNDCVMGDISDVHHFETLAYEIWANSGEIIGLDTLDEQVKLGDEILAEIIAEEKAQNG